LNIEQQLALLSRGAGEILPAGSLEQKLKLAEKEGVEMQIKMAVTKEGYVAFACEGLFTESIEKIVLNNNTRLFSILFKDSGEKVELDAPVEEEALPLISKHKYCGMGLYLDGDMLGAMYVPMEVQA